MEGMFEFLLVILAVVSFIKKNQKKKQTKSVSTKPAQNTAMQTVMEWLEEVNEEEQDEPKAQPVPQPVPAAQPVVLPEKKDVAQPKVKPRVEVREAPAVVVGSLGEDSHEGRHPCDEHDAAPMDIGRIPPEGLDEGNGIRLDWSGDNMVKAFIMQEVLMRPSQRRRA